jgi:hypothetical protein
MKRSALILGVASIASLLSTVSSVNAISPEKALRRGEFVAYTGAQKDWPRSDKHVVPVEVTKYGTVIFNQLPDHPYEVVGTVSAKGDMVLKHASQAAAAAGATAILVAGDKAFTDAGIEIQPRWLNNAEVPDPNASASTRRLDHPEQVNSQATPRMIRVNEITGILIRWKAQ